MADEPDHEAILLAATRALPRGWAYDYAGADAEAFARHAPMLGLAAVQPEGEGHFGWLPAGRAWAAKHRKVVLAVRAGGSPILPPDHTPEGAAAPVPGYWQRLRAHQAQAGDAPEIAERQDALRAAMSIATIADGELLNMIAFNPESPRRWRALTGDADHIGISPELAQDGDEPVLVCRDLREFLRGIGRRPVLPLAASAVEVSRLLRGYAAGLVAQDEAHARQLHRLLTETAERPPLGFLSSAA